MIVELFQRYTSIARANLLNVLRANTSAAGVAYADLFCEAMAFPLVTPDDLLVWLDEFDPYVELHPTEGHKKLSPTRVDDHVTIIDRHRLQ